MPDETAYTLVLRGESFTLSRAQIGAAPGSLLAAAFVGNIRDGKTATLEGDRHPAVFKVICDYLSGNPVFPLCEQDWAGTSMSEDELLRCLEADADYYRLPKLLAAVQEEQNRKEAARLASEGKVDA